MTNLATAVPASDRELVLTQRFALLPYTTPVAELDVRPGGASLIVMRGPDGNDIPNRGVHLEVVKNERLVFTDAYAMAWERSAKPFMTSSSRLRMKPARRNTPRALRIGRWPIGRSMKRWASIGIGRNARTNSQPWSRNSDVRRSARPERRRIQVERGRTSAAAKERSISMGPQMDDRSIRARHIARPRTGRATTQVSFILDHGHLADATQRRIVSGASLRVGGGIAREDRR
jgi:hypothetical protein